LPDPLVNILEGYKYEVLLRIAEFNHIDIVQSNGHKLRKEALIQVLQGQLFTAERARQALARLGPLERSVLDRMLVHGGEMATEKLRDEMGQEGTIQPAPQPTEWGAFYDPDPFDPMTRYFEDMIARLTLHGLVLSTGVPPTWMPSMRLGLSPGLKLVVPWPVRGHLAKAAAPTVEWGKGSLPAPTDATDISLAQRDLFIYWSYARFNSLNLTQAGLVQKRALRAVSEQLLTPEPDLSGAPTEREVPRLYFLRLCLQALRLLTHRNGQLRVASPGHVPSFWEEPPVRRAQACVGAWLRMEEWNELARLKVSAFDLDLHRARTALLDQLRSLPAGDWLSAERFLNRLAMTGPRLLFQVRDPYPDPSRFYDRSFRLEHNHWFAEMEATFVGSAISGPLHWLGITDISADGDRLLAFRINARGAHALGIGPAPAFEASDGARLVVQPSFQILALGPVPEATLARLETFAQRTKADRSAFEYLLSRETVYRGQQCGFSVADILHFLDKETGAALPQNVVRTLEEWGRQHQRIVFHHRIALCETADAELCDQLWNDAKMQAHLQRRLTPTVSLLKRGRLPACRDLLLQNDQMPAVSITEDPCLGQVEAGPEGVLQPLHGGPHLLLEECLRKLADRDDGKFRVTQAAVTRALGQGMDIHQYLAQLSRLHHGPLPTPLEMRVKAWGQYYGRASLQKAVLLEVKDSQTADELLADEELRPLLSRLEVDPRGRVLLVDSANLERLRSLLEERGVELG